MTRPASRIPGHLELLRQVWEANPDMRLGQLIDNAVGILRGPETYYIEDDNLADGLRKILALNPTQETA